jgi:hypothetical protein
MKTTIFCVGLIIAVASFRASASVIVGPISNPANGHDYYLLAPNSWTASEAEAESLGGTLAVIKNAAEQEWVVSTFGSYKGTNRNLWIGLHRAYPGGPFIWVIPEIRSDYSYWCNGQPDNGSGAESYVHMCAPNGTFGQPLHGGWNDLADSGSVNWEVPCGVVEVPGKSNEKSLSGKERSLIGTWYAAGDPNHPCWIVGTENMLFEIYDRRATRLIYTSEGTLLAIEPQHGFCGEIIKDRILWSNNSWWSREPVKYEASEKTGNSDR